LAMETEPHPLDYNQFEGVIPEGEYGGGTVMIWDRGVWAPVADNKLGDDADVDRQLAKGELKFVLLGKKLAGSWTLVRTRGGRQWLLIKHRDEHVSTDDVTVANPRSVVSGRTMAAIARVAGASERQLARAAGADPATTEARAAKAASGPAARARSRSPRRAAAQVDAVVARALETFGHIDILVNNAGAPAGPDRAAVVELSEEAWDLVVGINLKGTFLCSRAVARTMLERRVRGRIINISSQWGKVGGA